MKHWALLFLFLMPYGALAEDPSVVGHWFFYKKIYQGQEMPEPVNASLRLHFEFSAEGESFLYWWHEGDTDHCARKGRYHYEGGVLTDEIIWVDPKNTRECADDIDMQLGRKTRTPVHFIGDDLAIRFQIDGEPLDMVWKKLGEL